MKTDILKKSIKSINELILLEEEKIALFKLHKKGLVQKLETENKLKYEN